ncbi:conjugative transposon TraK protein [Pedobacter sp. CG_S7]|uniref:conjugative transposon protein TraK n=1 Tax=Pedobacter sp. CG_S7 TaxID=3143930 RepID=UPI0033917BF9
MFKKLENIETSFQKMRLFFIIAICAVFGLAGWVSYLAYDYTNISQNRIYILANGKALEAVAGDRKDNVPVEARDHIKTFHQYFFTLDPDESQQKASVLKALYLADETAKREFDNLTEKGYYTNIISSNISQTLVTDSISVDMANYPYKFKFYGKQILLRSTSVTTRSLITEGYLRNVNRSDNNSHGFLIERWSTIENNDINTAVR